MADRQVLICAGTGCVSSKSRQVSDALKQELKAKGMESRVDIKLSGCHGFCEMGPIFIVSPDDIFYCSVQPEDVTEIVEKHLQNGEIVERLLYADPVSGEKVRSHDEVPFYAKQMRRVLRNCGVIDPENVQEYIAKDGYKGLEKALTMEPEEIIAEVKSSGLRGRGGAGFPSGMKWEFTNRAKGDKKYVVCNADEGDPGAFMDRSVLEGDPHAVLEGMLIAGKAVGSDEGYIYVRAEYPLAVQRLKIAIRQAEEAGYLGENILGSGFNFRINLKEGAGAFVCGEETALLESIEGNRGMPRPRPPFPANEGLWGKPTLINNVETFANVAQIIHKGSEWYNSVGTERSKGTKVFALTGKINNTGLAEVPMGITMREIIFGIGGGIKDGKEFKAVQIGGPSGGCLPAEQLDLSVDYDSLTQAGAMMGSGGLVVMDEDTCMVDLARFFLTFTQTESCGKCIPCREGTKRMLEMLEKICDGKGEEGDIEKLEELALTVKDSALCGLGQTAPNPVLSTLRYFRHEYEAHIMDRRCPAGVCKNLISYFIDPEKCNGCRACAKACPTEAITGERKQPHEINQDICSQCGTCMDKCRQGAIYTK